MGVKRLTFAAIQQVGLAFVNKLYNELTKQSVGPSKPWTGKLLRIVYVESFVHEARISVGTHQHLYALLDFGIIVAGKRLHHY